MALASTSQSSASGYLRVMSSLLEAAPEHARVMHDERRRQPAIRRLDDDVVAAIEVGVEEPALDDRDPPAGRAPVLLDVPARMRVE